MTPDELFMKRAFQLASFGRGEVSPNPCVGCVIVAGGKIIGEGWHRNYGGPHAEVNAIQSVDDKGLLKEATVYVNLEPCSHHGKTPPCVDLLIREKVKRVVLSTIDPNPLVNGKGLLRLEEAGIEVVPGVLEKEGRDLNKRFFTYMDKQRPYIIVKWAQTSDGFIARANADSKWISNTCSRQLVHQWRTQEDAILVGSKTALTDNPRLTVRDWTGRNPVRIVIDKHLRLPETLHLFDRTQKTICFTLLKQEEQENLTFIRLSEDEFLNQVLRKLYSMKIQSVLVEGGRRTIDFFTQSGLWDEARIFYSTQSFGSGLEAPRIQGNLVSRENIMDDTLEIFYHG